MDPATPNAPFKWESASGLEHSCFSCAMKMSNPKARQTCYGIHSMPCFRYHQTMHAIGTSHNCFSCIQADELHENRHRRIAELVAEYRAAGGADEWQTPASQRIGLEELPVNVRQLQLARRRFDIEGNDDEGENDENDDTETVTDATTSTSDSTAPPPKLTKAEVRVLKKAAKAVKSQNKAFKNQAKHTISVRSEDVEAVNKVLHGETASGPATHPLASDKTVEEVIQRNMGFMASIEEHKKQLMSSIGQRRRNDRERRRSVQAFKDNKKRRFSSLHHDDDFDEDEEEMETLLTAVLTKLGVDQEHIKPGYGSVAGSTSTKKTTGKSPAHGPGASGSNTLADRLAIVANLKSLVKDDLERFENEQRETCIRAGGFWRYVGRSVFERMTKVAQELDWRTGEKLKERSGDD